MLVTGYFQAVQPNSRNSNFWHKDQQGEMLSDGSYPLTLPYYDDRELMHDILRQGSHVDILEPEELKIRVKQELQSMLGKL